MISMSSPLGWPRKSGKKQLQFLTWNVRGLGDYAEVESKVRQINELLSGPLEWDVFFMQEHKLDLGKIAVVKQTLLPQGETTWWPSDETRGGVAVTINRKAGIKVLQEGQDPEGMFGWMLVSRGQEVFRLCNAYCPCNERDRRLLWGRLCATLDSSSCWVFGGDIDFVEQTFDKPGGVP